MRRSPTRKAKANAGGVPVTYHALALPPQLIYSSHVSDRLFRIDRATVVRPSGETVFENFSWIIREGETWAIVGPVGSGKTSLTDVLLGSLRVTSGTADWPLLDRLRTNGRSIAWPSQVIARVAFKEESHQFSYRRHYYQQRFNFIEPQDDFTLDQFLHAGTVADEAAMHRVAGRLGLGELRRLSFIKLSSGQTRRARIARALLAHPEILILDEPFAGLDTSGRQEVQSLLERLTEDGTRLLLITSPESIPDWATHVLELVDRGVIYCGPRTTYQPRPTPMPQVPDQRSTSSRSLAEPVIELRNVSVTHGGRAILRNVNWTVHAGERWALLGPNGAGKTTLLSLICGDHPQAYANDVAVFGRRRGDGESIWDVKRRIGLVSPEMHVYFSEPLTAERAAATGFFDVLVSRPTTAEQDARVRELFAYFGISDLAARPFGRLSTGQQRIVLLVRSLVKDPPLLVLDEPFQALDRVTIDKARAYIDDQLSPDRTVLFVTHNESELPCTVTRRLLIDRGIVVHAD